MGFRLNVCVLVLGLLQAQCWGCPDGWKSHNRSCYTFLREEYNWFDAKVACGVIDSKLVEVETHEENQYLAGLLHSYGESDAWIGLEDILEENEFVWVSTNQRPTLTFWGTNEPNDWKHAEDCVAIHEDGNWFDVHCENSQFPFVCEMPSTDEEIIG